MDNPRPSETQPGDERRRHARERRRIVAQRWKERHGTTTAPCLTGRGGMKANYEGEAVDWDIYPALGSRTRLLWMVDLCAHGPATATRLERLAALCSGRAFPALRGMWEVGLLHRHRPEHQPGDPGPVPTIWSATDFGRKMLWEAGWTTRQLIHYGWHPAPLRNDVNTDPLRAVRRHVQERLLIPAALAVAWQMLKVTPCSVIAMAQRTGIARATVFVYMQRWQRMSWVERDGVESVYLGHDRYHTRHAWRLTPQGRLAIERHVDAMRRAALASGYQPTSQDLIWPRRNEYEWEADEEGE